MNKKIEQKNKLKEVKNENKDLSAALFSKRFRTSYRYEEALVQEDGKAHINVDLTKVKSPFSIYSYDKRMDAEIFSYIEDQVFFLRASVPVVINFDDGGKYNEELKEKIRKCVKRHYSLMHEDLKIEHLKKLFWGIGLFIVGLMILAVYIILSSTIFTDNNVAIEIICILSWVFIWQSADMFFFSGHQRRIEIKNADQLAKAEITFSKVK